MLRGALAAFDFAFLGLVAEGATLVGGGVFDFAVDGAAFVVLGEIFCDGQTALSYEEQSMAVFVDLHIVARADPRSMLDLFFLAGVEAAGAERPADVIDVLGQAQDHRLGDPLFRVGERAGFLAVSFDEQTHSFD